VENENDSVKKKRVKKKRIGGSKGRTRVRGRRAESRKGGKGRAGRKRRRKEEGKEARGRLRVEICFHDREEEIKELMNILDTRPDIITFVYGPINSGKTELFNYLIGKLPEEYKVFYINLRGVYVREADDFLKVLFEVEEEERTVKEFLKVVIDALPRSVGGIPIPKSAFLRFFEGKEVENVFRYLEMFFKRISEKFIPVLIMDELQVIKDVKIDELLIYKLFNFFIRLTKELHVCHVFAVTSDSLFIERIYAEAMLHGRCRFLLVDDFDYEETREFLKRKGLSDEEIAYVWENVGGKPVYLVEIVKSEDKRKKVEELLSVRESEIRQRLKILREFGERISIYGEEYNVDYERVIEALSMFAEREHIDNDEIDEISKRYLVKLNILFADPVRGKIKTQSKIDLIAIRNILHAR